MGTMSEYIKWRGDIPFSMVPLLAIDSMIFSTVCYIHMDQIFTGGKDDVLTIKEAKAFYDEIPKEQGGIRKWKDPYLLEAMVDSVRFGDIKVMSYREELDMDAQSQFAAVTYVINDELAHVTFRGTDSTLVGWKEDLNMMFNEVVPGQDKAREYLEHIAEVFPGRIIVGGHSKGGNLAVYASATANASTQDRIDAVYSFDGPGFLSDILESDGYKRVEEKVHSFLPESSLFGMMLNYIKEYKVVKSTNPSIGLLQHDPYSWSIMGGDFEYKEKLANSCMMTDSSFKNIVRGMTVEERKAVGDAFFESINGGDVKYVSQVFSPANIVASIQKKVSLDKEEEKAVKEMSKHLHAILFETLTDQVKNSVAGIFGTGHHI